MYVCVCVCVCVVVWLSACFWFTLSCFCLCQLFQQLLFLSLKFFALFFQFQSLSLPLESEKDENFYMNITKILSKKLKKTHRFSILRGCTLHQINVLEQFFFQHTINGSWPKTEILSHAIPMGK